MLAVVPDVQPYAIRIKDRRPRPVRRAGLPPLDDGVASAGRQTKQLARYPERIYIYRNGFSRRASPMAGREHLLLEKAPTSHCGRDHTPTFSLHPAGSRGIEAGA